MYGALLEKHSESQIHNLFDKIVSMIASSPPEPTEGPENRHYAVGEGPATVVSISLPRGTLDALRAIAGRRGVSAAVAESLERLLRDRARDAYLDAFHEEHGEFTDEETAEVHAAWARAAEKEKSWRARRGK